MNTAVKDVMTIRVVSVKRNTSFKRWPLPFARTGSADSPSWTTTAGPGGRLRQHAGNDHRPAASQGTREGAG